MNGWTRRGLGGLASLVMLAGCAVEDDTAARAAADSAAAAPAPAPATQPAPAPVSDLRLEVDIAARQLHVYRGGERVASHPVAVGSSEWPTPTGEWTIGQVIFNPRWVPPEESWAEDAEVAEPGDPENPLGRAQLVYDIPNSIHGTNEPESLGKAVSHGSIRASNEVVVQLAREIMEAGGVQRDEAFFQQVEANPSERVDVSIPNPVPIRVVSGGS